LVAVQAGQNSFGDDDIIDFTPTRRVTHHWWPKKFDTDLGYIIGLIIAEGSIEAQRVVIYNYDQDIIDYLQKMPAGLTFRYEGNGRNVCSRVALVDLLGQLGFEPGIVNCYNKFIPGRLLRCSRSVLVSVLCGMFDGDGHSNRYNGEVGYSSASKLLIDQLRIVLLNFDIISKTSVSERGVVVGPKGHKHIAATAYQLKMSTIDSNKFYEKIGFRLQYKQDKRRYLSSKPFVLVDRVTTRRIQDLLAGYTKSEIRMACKSQRHLLQKKKQFTIETVKKLVHGLKISDQFVLDRLAEADGTTGIRVVWLPVRSKTVDFSKTVNLRVDKHQSFTANGIITHNCQIERTLYKFRSRPHCRVCYNPDRPIDSALYLPGDVEYGIINYEELFIWLGMKREKYPDNYLDLFKCNWRNRQFPPGKAKQAKAVQRLGHNCPHCKTILEAEPVVTPLQGRFGGSATILFRGNSKVFNMWCLNKSEMVLSDNGPITISEAIDKSKVSSCAIYGLEGLSKIVNHFSRGITKTLKLKTLLGYEIECSPEHRFYCLKSDGPTWIEAKDLREDDLLGIQYDQRFFADNNDLSDIKLSSGGHKSHDLSRPNGLWHPPSGWTEELAYIIGLFIAEGSYSYNKLVIYNIDPDIIQRLVNNNLGLNFIHEPKFQRVSLCNKRFIEFLLMIGFSDNIKCDKKSIPGRLLCVSYVIQKSLIRGMFDGDGGSNKSDGRINYSSTSHFLIKQLRMLLLNMGFLSSLTEAGPGSFPGSKKIIYKLTLSTLYSFKFYNEIGFTSSYKQGKQEHLAKPKRMLYCLAKKFEALYNKYPIKSFGPYRYILKNKTCLLESIRKHLLKWTNVSFDPDYQFLEERLDECERSQDKIAWLPIKSISHSESPLCEISVDSETHSYVANGIITHNSQVARTVILAFVKKEGRDKKNSTAYRDHLSTKMRLDEDRLKRFFAEAEELCKHNNDHMCCLDALQRIIKEDDKPWDGIIGKLVEYSNLSRSQVTAFIKAIRLRSFDFTDSPLSQEANRDQYNRKYADLNQEPEEY